MEGVKGLREAFNAVSEPIFSCRMALLSYERKHDTEFQILTFRGTGRDGSGFEIKSDDLRPGASLADACAATATRLLAMETPKP